MSPALGGMPPIALPWEGGCSDARQALEINPPVLSIANLAHITGLSNLNQYIDTVTTRSGLRYRRSHAYPHSLEDAPLDRYRARPTVVAMLTKSTMSKVIGFFARMGYHIRFSEYDSLVYPCHTRASGRFGPVMGIYQLKKASPIDDTLTGFDKSRLLMAIGQSKVRQALEEAQALADAQAQAQTQVQAVIQAQSQAPVNSAASTTTTAPSSAGPATPRTSVVLDMTTPSAESEIKDGEADS